MSFFIWQTTPSVALIRSSSCGYNILDGPAAELPFRRIGLSQTIQAETYVTQCYGSSSSGACNVFAKKNLAYNTSDEVCPFESSDICISTNSTPIRLDSGLINSHNDLGINALPKIESHIKNLSHVPQSTLPSSLRSCGRIRRMKPIFGRQKQSFSSSTSAQSRERMHHTPSSTLTGHLWTDSATILGK